MVPLAGTRDHRFPLHRRIPFTVTDLHRTVERVECPVGVPAPEAGGRCECRQCYGGGATFRPDEQGDAGPETVAEQGHRVVVVAGVRESVHRVASLPLAIVPRAVVEPDTGDAVGRERVSDCPEPCVASTAAHLRVWRASDDGGVGVGGVDARPHVTLASDANFVHVPSRVRRCKCFKVGHAQRANMGILSRASYIVRSKVNGLLNRAEDPSETLDYSYEQLRDELQEVKQGIADLTTQKKRLEIQQRRLEENVEKHNEQAREAVRQDREDLARRALEKKKQKMNEIEELESQIQSLQSQQDNLVGKKDDLQSRIEQFRTKKETMKARYKAAEASSRVSEAMTGAGDEMEDVGRAIDRAEERTEKMEARAAAMDELQESGTFDDALSDKDNIDRELEELSTDSEVDAELDTLKQEVGQGDGDAEGETAAEPADTEAPDVDEEAVESELEGLQEEEN